MTWSRSAVVVGDPRITRSSRTTAATRLAVAFLAGTLLLPGAVLGEQPDGAAAPSPAFNNAMRFRTSLGLTASPEYVERSLVEAEAFPDTEYGVPLTLAEAKDLEGRWERARLTQPALDYAAGQDDYAGMYFDQQQQGRAVFRFADRLGFHAQRIASILPAGVEVIIAPADRSLSDLMRIYEEIVNNRIAWKAIMPAVSVDVDVVTNRVVVGLERWTPDAADKLVGAYGDAVTVEVLGAAQSDACVSRNTCGGTSTDPWKGGLKIFLGENPAIWCTSGALARRGSNLVMITAAHCLVNGQANYGDVWKHHKVNPPDPRPIGDALGGNIANGSNDGCPCHGDVGWIDVDHQAGVTPLDLFYASSSSDLRDINAVPGDSDYRQQVGEIICRGAPASGYICGTIDKLVATRLGGDGVDGHPVDQLRRTDYDATPGDSGGVMFFQHNFLGIHNDSLTDVFPPASGHSWYSTGQTIESYGNDICESTSC